jgi:hypothetical protein
MYRGAGKVAPEPLSAVAALAGKMDEARSEAARSMRFMVGIGYLGKHKVSVIAEKKTIPFM